MKMWSGDAPARANAADDLPARYGITHGHERSTQMVITGHEAHSVVYVDRQASVEEIAYECHDAAVGRADQRAGTTGDIQSEVRRAPHAVHLAAGAEGTGDARLAGTHERKLPEPGDGMRARRGVARQCALTGEPDEQRAVGSRCESLSRLDSLARFVTRRHRERDIEALHDGIVTSDDVQRDGIGGVQGNGRQRLPALEMQRFARQFAAHRVWRGDDHE